MGPTADRNLFVFEPDPRGRPDVTRILAQNHPGIVPESRVGPLRPDLIDADARRKRLARRVPWLGLSVHTSESPERIRLFRNTMTRWQWWVVFLAGPLWCAWLFLGLDSTDVTPLLFAVSLPAWLIAITSLGPGNRFELEIDEARVSLRDGRAPRRTVPTSSISHCEIHRYVGSEGSQGAIGTIYFDDGTQLSHNDAITLLRAVHWIRPDLELIEAASQPRLHQRSERRSADVGVTSLRAG